MKPISTIIRAGLLFFLFTCEKDPKYSGPEPKDWFLSGVDTLNYTIDVDKIVFQHGSQSATIKANLDSDPDWATLMQRCNGDKFRGKRVRMNGFIETYGTESTMAMMWVRVDDYTSMKSEDFDNMGDRPVSGVSNWTKCTIVFDVPDSVCVLNYGLILIGPGQAWFDNVSFEEVPETTYKTAWNINGEIPEGTSVPVDLAEDIRNPDFEE
jgi:hypothetical protein